MFADAAFLKSIEVGVFDEFDVDVYVCVVIVGFEVWCLEGC